MTNRSAPTAIVTAAAMVYGERPVSATSARSRIALTIWKLSVGALCKVLNSERLMRPSPSLSPFASISENLRFLAMTPLRCASSHSSSVICPSPSLSRWLNERDAKQQLRQSQSVGGFSSRIASTSGPRIAYQTSVTHANCGRTSADKKAAATSAAAKPPCAAPRMARKWRTAGLTSLLVALPIMSSPGMKMCSGQREKCIAAPSRKTTMMTDCIAPNETPRSRARQTGMPCPGPPWPC
mmetsp:Transcript_2922/g.9118  ORF Transcript_2922/g.9118 Transcript_2922/m.9118 type:complete len:239 (+) Transcript_2922:264-980(+)